jgi:hypothetical protein
MLKLTIAAIELFNQEKQCFESLKEQSLQLEHSLVSLSKWESKWCKPFLTKEKKSIEESIDYIRCMTLTQNVNPEVYNYIKTEDMDQVTKYIESPMTATTFRKDERPPNREIVTAELIYYWMIAWGIPFECQKWHLNRLLTLINVCNIKNNPPKKRSQTEIMRSNAALNAERRRAMNSNG